ncbi:MAG TPA: 5'-methylthioadenosine/adenosylhomocysteine nucleosidase [Epulopiscium sp.]|nr:5'-methylthioadenosine/adenosylhomocysteine nucleosidase [Candidatus Epulonipiscium sp.]
MKSIGIIGAMEEEIIVIRRNMTITHTKSIASMEFYEGIMDGQKIVLVRCGIGKVNAAVCTQILIDIFNVSYIINTGVAGGLHPDINIGDIIISSDTVEHDMDVTAFGHEKGYIPRMDMQFFEADEWLVEIAKRAAEEVQGDHKVYVGRIASGDQFVSSMKVKEEIYTNFTAYCAEMEGAAIAHTCFLNKIPFVVIRAISDKADQSAEVNFDDFVDLAAKNASQMIEAMIKEIAKME